MWRVRWRDDAGRARSKVVGRKADATALDGELKRRKRTGELADLDRGLQPLSGFVTTWWDRYASHHLAARTRASYITTWDRHVGPYLGDERLRDLTPARLEDWVAELRAREVGEPTIFRALAILQGVLSRAVEWGELGANPAAHVRRPRVMRTRAIVPLAPAVVAELAASGDQRVSRVAAFMGYAGLRPSELRALSAADIGAATILVDKATDADGGIKPTKNLRTRNVRIRDELRPLLPAEAGLLLPGLQSDESWKAWVRHHWSKHSDARPYDLRHTFVSTLINEGLSPLEVAVQAGHLPSVSLDIYGHLFEERRADA